MSNPKFKPDYETLYTCNHCGEIQSKHRMVLEIDDEIYQENCHWCGGIMIDYKNSYERELRCEIYSEKIQDK